MDGVAHHRRGKVVETHHVSYLMALRILGGGKKKKMVLCTWHESWRERTQFGIMLSNW